MANASEYDRLANEIRQLPAPDASSDLDLKLLAQYGMLAASSHNTQPWTFEIGQKSITLRPDFDRRCPVVDPDDAHLFKSLGCAAENCMLAAQAQGYSSELSIDADKNEIRIDCTKSRVAAPTALFAAIPKRQCTRTLYDGGALSVDEQKQLERAGAGEGIRTILLTADQQLDAVAQYVSQGDNTQLSDTAFRKELISWIRFNPNAAMRHRDGLSNSTSGNPALPGWVANLIISLVLTPQKQAKADVKFIQSSAAIAVIVAGKSDKQSWIHAGRAYERLALHATDLGIRHACINQPIEVDSLRPELESWLGLKDESVLLMVRLGRATLAPFSLRRNLDDVIVQS